MLTHDQRYKVSIQLVSLLVEGFKPDQSSDEGQEAQLVCLFACNFACNNTRMVDGKEDAHALCDEFFKSYYGLLDSDEERLAQHNQEITDRFQKYYEATALIGTVSPQCSRKAIGCEWQHSLCCIRQV